MTNLTKWFRSIGMYGAASLFAASMIAFAQDPATEPPPNPEPPAPAQPSGPGWHRFSPPSPQAAPPEVPPEAPAPEANPGSRAIPESVTIPAGTFVTVRLDQFLSSDKSHEGDGFSATLARPLVAGGLVVSQRGQTLGGHVIEAEKAGRVKGVSHLQIGLNSLTLADGQQVPIQTELTSITGPTSQGRDAGAILTTTATGAIIGSAVDWGRGAAIGAGAGLAAGVIGVLATRGRPTVIYPESQLTFRLAKPVTISTERAPQAFADASTLNSTRAGAQRPPQGPPPRGYQGAPYPPPAYYGPAYPYWGPSFGVYFGPGYYGHRFYGRGYYHR